MEVYEELCDRCWQLYRLFDVSRYYFSAFITIRISAFIYLESKEYVFLNSYNWISVFLVLEVNDSQLYCFSLKISHTLGTNPLSFSAWVIIGQVPFFLSFQFRSFLITLKFGVNIAGASSSRSINVEFRFWNTKPKFLNSLLLASIYKTVFWLQLEFNYLQNSTCTGDMNVDTIGNLSFDNFCWVLQFCILKVISLLKFFWM